MTPDGSEQMHSDGWVVETTPDGGKIRQTADSLAFEVAAARLQLKREYGDEWASYFPTYY